jgi:hypothetical protein
MQPRSNPRCWLVLAHLEYAASRLGVGPDRAARVTDRQDAKKIGNIMEPLDHRGAANF